MTATSEVDEYAILAYHAIHTPETKVKEASEEEMQKYMEGKNIPLDPKGERKILKNKRLKDLYVASVANNNLGDISKITDDEIPKVDLFTYSFPCFTKDNLVLTEEGYKPINEVVVGDKVLTHNNTYEKVVKTFDNGMQPTVKVKAMGIDEIVTTPNHKFYVREKYREWNNDKRSYNRLFKEPQWKEIKDVTRDYYLGMAVNQKSEIPKWNGITFRWGDGRSPRYKNELQELMDNQDFWWIVGRYLADGWTRTQGGIVFGIGKDKTSEFEGRLGKVFNYSSAEEKSVVKYHVPLKELSKFVEQFGKGAANKKLSKSVFNLPIDLLESFLEGYLSGDGSLINGYWKANSVSRELMLGIGQVVMKVYKRPYSFYKDIRTKTTVIEGRTVNQKDTYSLSFKKEAKKQDNAFYENGYMWIPFNAIEDTGNEDVYGIEVSNAHSFTVQNVIVHNCQDVSNAGKQKGLDKNSGTRSSLLWECEKIIEAVKPRYLLMENVKALVNKKNKPQFDIWLEYLEELGYKNFWQVLNAKDHGIPQNRERVFVVSILDEDADYKFPVKMPLTLKLKDILEDSVDDSYYLSQEQVNRITFSTYNVARTRIQEKEYSDTLCARDFKDPKCVKVRQIGRHDTPKRRNANTYRVYDKEAISPTLTTAEGGNRNPHILEDSDILEPSILTPKRTEYGKSIRKDYESGKIQESRHSMTELQPREDGLSNTLTTVQKDNLVLASTLVRNGDLENYELVGTIYSNASKRFMRKPMKGLSRTLKSANPDTSIVYKKKDKNVGERNENLTTDNITIGASRGRYTNDGIEQQLEINKTGNTNTITSVQKDNYLIVGSAQKNTAINKDRVTPTLTSAMGQGGGHTPMHNRTPDFKVRKLTPNECWRLMGIADEDFEKASKVVSNSQLYKQAGNSIVVDVLEGIFKQLFNPDEMIKMGV